MISTKIVGIIPGNAEYRKMFQAYKACEVAGISIPKELKDFFNWEKPTADGIEVEIVFNKYRFGYADIYVVDIEKLPNDVKRIMFVNEVKQVK